MTFTHVFAQSAVTDLETAERWYAVLLDGPPDERPMPGLLTWVLGEGRGVQVWLEAASAGRSAMILGVEDLDAVASRLAQAGVQHDGVQPGGGARLLVLADPDGNRVVLTGT